MKTNCLKTLQGYLRIILVIFYNFFKIIILTLKIRITFHLNLSRFNVIEISYIGNQVKSNFGIGRFEFKVFLGILNAEI